MKDNITISKNNYSNPAMDFASLKQKGIEYIQQFSGDIWTDYNESDPGITILEALCYAITELGYKTENFQPKWFFESELNPLFEHQQAAFKKQEILKTNPVTIHDFRELLIKNVKEVRYVWLKANQGADYGGLYDVDVLISNYKDIYRSESEILLDIQQELDSHRNLCEDYENITIFKFDLVSVYANIYIDNNASSEKVMANIMMALEELFQFGIVKDEELEKETQCLNYIGSQESANISIYRIKKVIFDVEHVIDIKELMVCQNDKQIEKEILVKKGERIALNIKRNDFINCFRIYKGTSQVLVNYNRVYHYFNNYINSSKVEKVEKVVKKIDAEISPNQANNIIHFDKNKTLHLFQEYYSIQRDFPYIYDLGEFGLPEDAKEERKIEVKQLKAYLLFFEQVMADYLKQLVNIQDLYSTQMYPYDTYFTQIPRDIPYLESILKGGWLDKLLSTNFNEENKSRDLISNFEHFVKTLNFIFDPFFKRKNRFMNHLFARFGGTDVANNIDYYHEYIKEEKYGNHSLLEKLALHFDQLDHEILELTRYTVKSMVPIIYLPAIEKLKKKIKYIQNYPNYSNNKNLGTLFNSQKEKVIDSILVNKLKFMLDIDMKDKKNITDTLYDFSQKNFPLKKAKKGECTDERFLYNNRTYQETLSDFMLYGNDPKNYVIIQKHEAKEEIRHIYYQLKYKSPSTFNTITINQKAKTRSKCYQIQGALITKIKKIQKDSRGFYALENILLRDSSYNTSFKIFNDKKEAILDSLNKDTFVHQGKVIDDILHYGIMKDNYEAIPIHQKTTEIEEVVKDLLEPKPEDTEEMKEAKERMKKLKDKQKAKQSIEYKLYVTKGSTKEKLAVYPKTLKEEEVKKITEELIAFFKKYENEKGGKIICGI